MQLLLFASLIVLSAATSDNLILPRIENINGTYDGYRISPTTIPSSYNISLTVPQAALTGGETNYTGQVVIVFQVTETKNTILLNSLVDIVSMSLTVDGGQLVEITNHTTDPVTETVTILLPAVLSTNLNYTLTINYIANLDPINMNGFYRSEYLVNGVKEYLATTQMQPTHARKVFPCFDEPEYKAVFSIQLTYPANFTAVANTPQNNLTISADQLTTTTIFEDTPKMSTYLVAFTLSKFSCIRASVNSTETTTAVLFGVCSRDNFAADRAVALTYGNQLMDVLETYTNYSYSSMGIQKIDQFAIPDFDAGAMENWGLVNYREYMLLYNEQFTSKIAKQRIIAVIAHEFAHMWFGNLVTTKWWNSTFLNEGFARYFQYFSLSMLSSLVEFEMEKQFIIEQQQAAFLADSSLGSPSLTSNVWTPSQIYNNFGTISYSKGASILRMVENVIGSTVFQSALQRYIRENAFGVATPDILWNTLSDGLSIELPSNLTLTQVLDNWTNQPGFPVINVTTDASSVILSQKRFLYNGTDNMQWYVPIVYIASNGTIGAVWLQPNISVRLEDVLSNNEWIFINHNSFGYYRVSYDNTMTTRLKTILQTNHSLLTDLNRAQLLDDSLNLARSGEIKYSEALELLSYLRNETSYYPWYTAIKGLKYLTEHLGNDSVLGQRINGVLLDHIEDISSNISTLNWSSVDHITSLKLQMVWSTACRIGQSSCINEVKRLFREFRVNNTSINPNIRDVVYCNALRYSDDIDTDWTFLWNRLQTVDQPHETLYILSGLGCARSRNHLMTFLNHTFDGSSIIRVQDLDTAWSSVVSGGAVGLETAFEHFRLHHQTLLNYYPHAISVLSGITSRFTTLDEYSQFEAFANQLEANSTVGTAARTSLSSISANIDWQTPVKTDLNAYFNITPPTPTPTPTPTPSSTSIMSYSVSVLLIVVYVCLVM